VFLANSDRNGSPFSGRSAQQPPANFAAASKSECHQTFVRHRPTEQKHIVLGLASVPAKPAFGKDFEVARGHSTLDPNTPIPGMQPLPPGAASAADWVRVRREFPGATLFSNVQYSFSVDAKDMLETLVLRVRDPKDVMQIAIEDSASARRFGREPCCRPALRLRA